MIKTKIPIGRIGCLFIYMLCLLATAMLAINPAQASGFKKRDSKMQQLTGFEGYYHLDKDTNLYLQIIIRNNNLILKQLWDEQEIPFEQKSALYFYNEEKSFPLTFTKDANGKITQVLAFEKDTWIKAKGYKPVEKKEIKLSAEKMQAFAGQYKMARGDHEAYLQFTVKENSLEVKELWSGKIFTIVPESALVFFGRKSYYPVTFNKDKDGNISQALIFKKDIWVKVKS